MMFRRTSILIFSLVFILAEYSPAQLLPFRNYSIESGLSESGGHDLIQDSKGYIWVATGYGLNRFNGYEFKQYYEDNGLANNRVNSLMEDSGYRIWAGTESGISILEKDTLLTPAYLSDLSGEAILSIFEDKDQQIWIGTDGKGLWVLDSDLTLRNISDEMELDIKTVEAVDQAENGAIWVASQEGLVRIHGDEAYRYTEDDGIPSGRFQDLTVDRYNRLWIASREGLIRYDHGEFRLFNRNLPNSQVLTISVENYDNIWVGTENGLARFDGTQFTNYTREQGLPATIIRSSMIDREGNLWLGTLGAGISHFSGDLFRSFNIDTGIPNNVVTGFIEDGDNNIWIATYGGGAVRYDGSNLTVFDESDGLVDNKVYSFLRDSRDRIWIATREGISIYDDGRFSTFEAFDIDFKSVRKIYQDQETGEMWIATYNDGLYRLNEDGYEQYTTSSGFPNNTVMDIKKDEDGVYWFATYGGVVRYDGEDFRFITIADNLPSNGVIHIFIDHNGDKWFSTFNGPVRYRDGSVERIIRSRQVETIFYFTIQDSQNRYWFGTNKGLILFRYEDFNTAQNDLERILSYRSFTTNQGLIANELNAGGSYLASDNSIWLGTVEGLSRLSPGQVVNNSVSPGLEFEEILISGSPVNPGEEYTFSHDQNFLQASFSGLTYEAPEQVLYEFRLRGFENEWRITRENSVRYPSLPAGEYRFQIRAYNSDGAVSENTASFSFQILPPFYFQAWFIFLAVALLVGFILFIIHYYRISKQVEIEKMRVQIASDLHDDVGSSLTELALQTDFLQAGRISAEMKDTLRQLGEQSRKIVTSLDDIVWSIDARNDTAGDLTDRMQDYVNQIFTNGGPEVEYHFDELRMDEKLPVQVRENVYLIFKEAVNNIIKHSNAAKADIKFSFDGHHFDLWIKDDGTKQEKNRKTGQGLRNIRMRAGRIGAAVEIDQGDGFSVRAKGSI